eukprot:6163413-Pleurochrysis_carterae.AAC.1
MLFFAQIESGQPSEQQMFLIAREQAKRDEEVSKLRNQLKCAPGGRPHAQPCGVRAVCVRLRECVGAWTWAWASRARKGWCALCKALGKFTSPLGAMALA